MTSPEREPPLSRILANCQNSKERLELEHKILQAAFKHSYNEGDKDGAAVAHKGLMAVIQQQLYSGDGSSTGSVIPKSFWERANTSSAEPDEASVEQNGGGHDHETTEMEPFTDEAAAIQLSAAEPTEAEQAAQALADISAAAAKDLPKELQDVAAAAGELGLSPDSTLPEGGPTAYLDFGREDDEQPQAETPPEPDIADTSVPTAPPPAGLPLPEPEPPPRSPSQLIRTQSFYQIIGVNNLSSFEEIHLKFLRIMRRLLQTRYSDNSPITDMREFREVLRAICVAHDVLKDPVTRTDYDLRQMGMRTTEAQTAQAQAEQKASGAQTNIRLMLGELLECASILDTTELEIALDMHKAEPGLQFGEFLVRAGFLNRAELDSAILAQRLISSGKITVAQFKTAIKKMRDDGTSFFDTLTTEGWISADDIVTESAMLPKHMINEPASTAVRAESPPGADNGGAEENAPPLRNKLSGENAVPQWAGDLDWTESDSTSGTTAGAPPNEESGATDSEDQEQQEINDSASTKNNDSIVADRQLISGDNGTPASENHPEDDAQETMSARTQLRFEEDWSDMDRLAETQAIDLKAIRAVLDSEVKDSD